MESDIKLNAYIQTMAVQRNQALDGIVQLSGELAEAREEIRQLKERLEKPEVANVQT